MILQPGQVIFNRYRIEEFIGHGGMQEVYRATDLALDRLVALKTPKNEQAAKRFQRSALLSAKVRHPSVAATLDYFEEGQRGYLIEELIIGTVLKYMMSEVYNYLDPSLAAHVALHMAQGIAACHRENVWHRDLKPANVMVSDDLALTGIKITDFGIAKLVEEQFKSDEEGAAESSITQSQTLLGAAPYMSPEQMFTPKKADKRTDIWSFGAILYSLLLGVPPYGRSFANIAKNIHTGNYPKPPAWISTKWQFRDLFNQLWGVVESCLQVDPSKRPTAEAIVSQLSKLCFSIHPRTKGTTKSITKWKSVSFLTTEDGDDVMYHIDSHYKEGQILFGEQVILSHHPGSPSPRAFPLLPARVPTE